MEGTYAVRVAVIGLMAAGSLYVLSPTWLQQTEVDLGGVQASAPTEPVLEAWFTVPDGSPDAATIDAVSARLDAAGLGVDRVGVDEAGRLVVYIEPGTRKDAITEAIAASGAELALYGPEALGIDPAAVAGAAEVGPLLDGAVSSVDLADDAVAIQLDVTAAASGASLDLTFAGPTPDGADPLFVALDGDPVGWLRGPVAAGATVSVPLVGDDPEALALKATLPALPEAVERVVPEVEVEETVAEQEEVAEVVHWYDGLLPDTKINLGLDLQGGIDLTLQVDQDAAVAAAVQRDRRMLADEAVKQGLDVLVQRDRTRPAIEVSYAGEFAKLQAFVQEQLRLDYGYLETFDEDGRTFHVWRMSEEREAALRDQAVEQNLETLRKRVDATGVKEPSIVKMGGGRINIQLPGATNPQQAIEAIGTQATLHFRMVDYEADQNAVNEFVQQAERELDAEQFHDPGILNDYLRSQGHLPDDRVVRLEYEERAEGELEWTRGWQLFGDVPLTGADIDGARVMFDQNNLPYVSMSFKPRGATVFCDITTENVGKLFAIILDEQIRSTPNIRTAICGGSASIEMGNAADAVDEANNLALVLRSGALTAPVDIGEVRRIGASLGADAIRGGAVGAGIGGLLTVTFMVLWYKIPGAIADVALMLNTLLVFALLSLFGATLTLPGIAGIALTIGMAVDANIIIYERIREELKLGVHARKAVDTGYDKGLSAILDANITTAIAGVVLYSYGTGPIKGFAVTLLIGIFTTLVTALFVTRTFMEMLTRSSDARLRL